MRQLFNRFPRLRVWPRRTTKGTASFFDRELAVPAEFETPEGVIYVCPYIRCMEQWTDFEAFKSHIETCRYGDPAVD